MSTQNSVTVTEIYQDKIYSVFPTNLQFHEAIETARRGHQHGCSESIVTFSLVLGTQTITVGADFRFRQEDRLSTWSAPAVMGACQETQPVGFTLSLHSLLRPQTSDNNIIQTLYINKKWKCNKLSERQI